MRVFAVDPGKTTGYWAYDSADPTAGEGGQLAGDAFLDIAYMYISSIKDLTVVCESFTITQRSLTQRGERLWSVEQIGVLRYLTSRYEVRYVEQAPSDAKSFCTDDKLKRIGWYHKGEEHCRDAARHALLFAVRNKHVQPHVLLEGVD